MMYNHQKAFAQLKRQHKQERALLRSTGISEARIDELFEADLRQLKRDRAFYIHLDLYFEPTDEALVDGHSLDTELHWLEQIENQALLEALENLAADELEIINLHINEQLPLTFVAALLDKPYSAVQRRYCRIIHKLKNYFS